MTKEEIASHPDVLLFAERITSTLRQVGVSSKTFQTLFQESEADWAAVVKLHTVMEASLTHLIVSRLGEESLSPVISKLETSDRTKGKLAFIEALNLLSSEERRFIKQLSEVRNKFAHKVSNLDTDIADYVRTSLDLNGRKEFRASILGLFGQEVLKNPAKISKFIEENPKKALILGASMVISSINLRLCEFPLGREESNPKEP